jgi:hypothetical protein
MVTSDVQKAGRPRHLRRDYGALPTPSELTAITFAGSTWQITCLARIVIGEYLGICLAPEIGLLQ